MCEKNGERLKNDSLMVNVISIQRGINDWRLDEWHKGVEEGEYSRDSKLFLKLILCLHSGKKI